MGHLIVSTGVNLNPDWRVDFQDALENGTMASSSGQFVYLTSGDLTMIIAGTNLALSDDQTLSAGTINSIILQVGASAEVQLSEISVSYSDLQSLLDGAAGVDPTSQDFVDLIAPVFAADALAVEGSDGDDFISGTAFGDTIESHRGDDTIDSGNGNDTITPGWGDNHVDGGDDTDTVILDGGRLDYQVTVKPDGTIVLIDMREDTHGDRSFYDNVENFQFNDVTVAADDLSSDIVHPGYYGPTYDQGGWELGWYTTGAQHLGWHYESGVDVGWFFNPWGWTDGAWGWETGWFIHEGWEYGWYESGAWAWGWHYDWGGWGNGLTIGLTFGWWIGNVYGPPLPSWYSGASIDTGGWEYGWHGEGQSLYGWHVESGWDFGWFSSAEGFEAGWFQHIGWELGWYTAGWSVYGWFYDAGGWGSGWDIAGTPGGWAGTQSGGWWTVGWVVGSSIDVGGWEFGWYAAGGWAVGWHTESGWDYGWYETPLGWSWGWYYHAGEEYGWYGTGSLAWGWHLDYGGAGTGWTLGWTWGGAMGDEFGPH